MGGGLMQLVAYGSQDIYLTGNPQITFFKIVYRRHTNFAIETIEHTFTGNPCFGKSVSAKITRNGDLITKMYLRVILSAVDPINSNFAWVRRIGHALVKKIEIDIGGTRIDKQYGTWLDIWYELARQGDHDRGYAKMIGDIPILTNYNNRLKPEYILYIPLQFWFNKFVGLAIPLIALQYHDTYIHVDFECVHNLIVTDSRFDINLAFIVDATILVNYIYLDTDERRRFAIVGHEYLIEQLQFNGIEPVVTSPTRYTLDFYHPTKEIFWAVRNGNYSSGKPFLYYTDSDCWCITDAATIIIEKSISVGFDPTLVTGVAWVEVLAGQILTVGTFNINNKNSNSVFINPTSVSYGNYGITDKIFADIIIDFDGIISIYNVTTCLTIRDLSIPLLYSNDTRYNPNDPLVNIFSNYGLLIDGSGNPIEFALLQFNGLDRFDRREGNYFNYVQPEQYHTNTPKDGINVYSFALYPEQHQPSGTANLSRIESTQLTLNFFDSTTRKGIPDLQAFNPLLPDLHFFNDENKLYIFALNYNIFRVFAGLGGISYTV